MVSFPLDGVQQGCGGRHPPLLWSVVVSVESNAVWSATADGELQHQQGELSAETLQADEVTE